MELSSTKAVAITVPPDMPDTAALKEYEELLAGASRLAIRNTGTPTECGGFCRCEPGEATITIDVDEKKGALIVGVKPPTADDAISDANYWYSQFATELKLGDGRVVMDLKMDQPALRKATLFQGKYAPPGVLAMDRDGPVRVTDETKRVGISVICRPFAGMPVTNVTHPQSVDEALRNGHQLTTPRSLNGAYACFNTCCVCPLAWLTCCAGPVFLMCCVPLPNLHSELKVRATRPSIMRESPAPLLHPHRDSFLFSHPCTRQWVRRTAPGAHAT